MNLKKIFIIPCSGEIVKYGTDTENKSIRSYNDSSNNLSLKVSSPLDKKTINLCNYFESNNNSRCTYNGNLEFIIGNYSNCSSTSFWNDYINFINNFNLDTSTNFYLVTHHNRIKETILKPLLDPKVKRHFANCTCIKISYNNNWIFEVIYNGFPDKKEYSYFEKDLWNNETIGIKNLNNNIIIQNLNKIKNKKNFKMYIMRHGNALHNKPLKLVGGILFGRIIDSNLTPLGVFQANRLTDFLVKNNHLVEKTVNVYCASQLNRSQHTVLQLTNRVNNYQNLVLLNDFFNKKILNKLENETKDLDTSIVKLINFHLSTCICQESCHECLMVSDFINTFFKNNRINKIKHTKRKYLINY